VNFQIFYHSTPENRSHLRFLTVRPNASYDIDDVRFNTNYVSNSRSSSEMAREFSAFDHMADADPNAVNTLIIEYDDPLAPKPDEKKDDKEGNGEKCP